MWHNIGPTKPLPEGVLDSCLASLAERNKLMSQAELWAKVGLQILDENMVIPVTWLEPSMDKRSSGRYIPYVNLNVSLSNCIQHGTLALTLTELKSKLVEILGPDFASDIEVELYDSAGVYCDELEETMF